MGDRWEGSLFAALRRLKWSEMALMVLVALIAFVLRRQVAAESLWVDELHTSWVVDGSFAEVTQRSRLGNQTPWYFLGLWAWVEGLGQSEWSLRLPSLLATSLASVILFWTGYRLTGSRISATVAGLMLALERSSIFYGSEVRGYSLVVLCVSIVLAICVSRLSGQERKASFLPGSILLALITACAVLIHVTAIWTIGIFAVCLAAVVIFLKSADEQRFCTLHLLLPILFGSACALLSDLPYLQRTWEVRDQWSHFAIPKSPMEIWRMWPWISTCLLPIGLWFGALLFGRWNDQGIAATSTGRTAWETMLPLVMLATVVIGTLAAWFVANQGWLALWHRRFLISMLPMLCLLSGALWSHLVFHRRGTRGRVVSGSVLLVLAVSSLLWTQGTLRLLVHGELRWVQRGEDWRGASRLLCQQHQPGEAIGVAAELIESSRLLVPTAMEDVAEVEYLSYPLRGLYGKCLGKRAVGGEGAGVQQVVALPPLRVGVSGVAAEKSRQYWLAWIERELQKNQERSRASQSAAGVRIVIRAANDRVGEWMDELQEEAARSGSERDWLYDVISFQRVTLVSITAVE